MQKHQTILKCVCYRKKAKQFTKFLNKELRKERMCYGPKTTHTYKDVNYGRLIYVQDISEKLKFKKIKYRKGEKKELVYYHVCGKGHPN